MNITWQGYEYTAEAIELRFLRRIMTRAEYEHWHSMERGGNYLGKCPSVPGGYYFADSFRSHLYRVEDHIKMLRLPEPYRDMYLYHGITAAYQERIDLFIADYGGSLYEAELERQAELYHMGYSLVTGFDQS